MAQLTPISSEERRCPLAKKHAMDTTSSRDTHATKRRRLSPPNMKPSLERDAENLVPTLLTPPQSSTTPKTLSLSLMIPQNQPSRQEQRTLAIRRASAQRWQPKLQRPFPLQSEIKQAYTLKLMRHYPNALTTVEPNFVKPRIDTSARVDRLLRRFPLPTIRAINRKDQLDAVHPVCYYKALSVLAHEVREAELSNISLQNNRAITASEYVQQLAWKNFSTQERNRIDRGREAMLQSGLHTDDLDLEVLGRANKLPEWRKEYTSRFRKNGSKRNSG
jgi:hypothetical protein